MRFNKPIKLLWGAQVLIFLMASCAPARNTPQPIPTSQTATSQTRPTPVPTPTSTPTKVPTIQPSEFIPPPLLCSPLAVQPLETIAEIITQPFIAPRQLDDGSYKDDAHHGLDLGYYTREGVNFTGTPALSAANGTIAAIMLNRPPYGDAILIETPYEQIPAHLVSAENIPPGNSLYILYAHLQNLQPFSLGDKITCGQQLAETGLTGFTGGPHLHFETRWGPSGQAFESMAYYHVNTTEQERANYVSWRMSGTFRLFDPMILLSPSNEN